MFFKRLILFSLMTVILIGCTANATSKDDAISTQTAVITNTAKPSATITPIISLTPTITSTPTPTITSSPTMTPTPVPIGGSFPLIAYSLYDRATGKNQVRVVQLQQEKTLAVIPWDYPPVFDFKYSSEFINPIEFSQDGTLLAYGVGAGTENEIFIYNLETGGIEAAVKLEENVYLVSLGLSPHNDWLLYTGWKETTRQLYMWLYHRPSKTKKYVGACGTYGAWISDNEFTYQDNFGHWVKANPTTLTTESINTPNRSALLGKIFSQWGARYIPELDLALFNGIGRDDYAKYFVLMPLETDEEILLVHIDDKDKYTRFFIRKILPSPDGNYFLIRGNHVIYEEDWNSIVESTENAYLISKDELPLTGNEEPLEDLFVLEWAPDSSAFLAYRPSLGIEREVVLIDVDTLSTLVDGYSLKHNDKFATISSRGGIDALWLPQPLDFQIQPYHTPTPSPSPTLEPGITPSPTPMPMQPLIDNLEKAETIQELDLNLFSKRGWEFNNAALDDGKVIVEGSGSWDAYFDYPLFDVNKNKGVLVKFKFEQKSAGIVALTRGEWDTTSYRQWGIMIGAYRTRPIISQGSDHSGKPETISEMRTVADTWYYLFLGINENNELIQLMWNPETPSNYLLGFYNYGDIDNASYYFHVGGDTGKITIGEVVFYEFENYNK